MSIGTLMRDLEAAKSAVAKELMRLYPPGSEVQFHIMSGQKNASTGKVMSLGYRSGYVRVKHNEAKPGSRYAYRDVHYVDLIRDRAAIGESL
jgi:hypothetical protein